MFCLEEENFTLKGAKIPYSHDTGRLLGTYCTLKIRNIAIGGLQPDDDQYQHFTQIFTYHHLVWRN